MITKLFEDKNIAVVIKPAGVSSEDTGRPGSVPGLLKTDGAGEIYTVHRLDLPASGIMVYAKTRAAAANLSRSMAENRFEKIYTIAVHGEPAEKSGSYTDYLFRDRQKNKTYCVKRERAGVKKAELEYTVIKTAGEGKDRFSLIRVKLLTGRTHQIRAQFASRGMPLAGDGKYGAKDNLPVMFLFCSSLSFPHPCSGEIMRFEEKDFFNGETAVLGLTMEDINEESL